MSDSVTARRHVAWRRLWPRVTQSLDRLIAADRFEDDDEHRRLRVATGMLLLLLLLIPLPMIGHWISRETSQATVLLGTWLTIIAGLLGTRRGWSSTAVGHLLSASIMLTAAINAIPLGGIHSPPAIAMLPVPLVHTLVVRGRSNWLWCGIGIGLLSVFHAFTDGPSAAALDKLLVLVTTMIALVAVASLFESSRRQRAEELNRARVHAEAAAEAKSQFLANMSHEIRTPLNGVLGMLGLMLEEDLDDHLRDYARTAHASGGVLLDLINDILDFSKIEAGQMLLEAVTFDLRSLTEDVLDQVAVLANEKGLELISRYVPRTPTHVVGDAGRIRQVLLNLVNNAVKFTEDGHVLVTVEQAETSDERGWLRISVEDTGVGITEDAQARVFEHFQQVDGSASRQHEGTGLGLAIVRQLTSLMEGRVGLSSTPSKGSTFWFELPLPVAEAPASPDATDLEGLEVLVVDDHRVSRRVLREQLTSSGLRVTETSSGPAALEQLTEAVARVRPFDVALLDYSMPRMDGLELTRRIRADDRLRDTQLVMLGSVTHRARTQELLDAGCAAALVKPVHHAELMSTLMSLRTRRTPNSESSSTDGQTRRTDATEAVARGWRLLVVDDNAINQKVAVRMLTSLGAHVDVAGNGLEALAQVEAFPYDLVFMDVQMPGMDGLEATAEIRRRRAGMPRLTIVAMTAHAQEEDQERCLAAGMDDYVRKPITRQELIRALRQHSISPAPEPGDVPSDKAVHRAAQPRTSRPAHRPGGTPGR